MSTSLPRLRSPTLFQIFVSFRLSVPSDLPTLSLHDALPISSSAASDTPCPVGPRNCGHSSAAPAAGAAAVAGSTQARRRSEEHTSELQSPIYRVSCPLPEKKRRYEPCRGNRLAQGNDMSCTS